MAACKIHCIVQPRTFRVCLASQGGLLVAGLKKMFSTLLMELIFPLTLLKYFAREKLFYIPLVEMWRIWNWSFPWNTMCHLLLIQFFQLSKNATLEFMVHFDCSVLISFLIKVIRSEWKSWSVSMKKICGISREHLMLLSRMIKKLHGNSRMTVISYVFWW